MLKMQAQHFTSISKTCKHSSQKKKIDSLASKNSQNAKVAISFFADCLNGVVQCEQLHLQFQYFWTENLKAKTHMGTLDSALKF